MNNIEIKSRNHFIDILKGICIIFVVITHFDFKGNELRMFFPFWIDMAVPIFMIVSGYVYACSFTKKNIENLSEAYKLKNIVNKIIRYSIPFLIAFIVGEFGYRIIGGQTNKLLMMIG